MGGQNHQPCGGYLRQAIQLSRTKSLAYLYLELANTALEDLLLSELDGQQGNLSPIMDNLHRSQESLVEFRKFITEMREKMIEYDYHDLPTLLSTNLNIVGEQLVAKGCLDAKAWQYACNIMLTGGFNAMLNDFDRSALELMTISTNLARQISQHELSAVAGNLHFVLEENHVGNFKVEFAQLYTKWNEFSRYFLASSLLSTELWYRHQNTGTILEIPQDTNVAVTT